MRAAAAFALGSTGLRVLHDAMARMAKQLMKGTLGTPLSTTCGHNLLQDGLFWEWLVAEGGEAARAFVSP
jgi:hypothetical protein